MIDAVKIVGVCGQDRQKLAPKGAQTRIVLFTPPGMEDRVGRFTSIVFVAKEVHKTYEGLKARGVTAAIDLGPYICEKPGGQEAKERIRRQMDYEGAQPE